MSNRIFSFRTEEEWCDYETPSEALQDVDDQDELKVGSVIYTGIKKELSPQSFILDAEEVLEHYDNMIYDNCGEYAHENTGSDQVTDEAKEELNALLKQWADKHITLNFYEVEHEEEIEVTQEMIDAFKAGGPIPLPEFKHKEVQ